MPDMNFAARRPFLVTVLVLTTAALSLASRLPGRERKAFIPVKVFDVVTSPMKSCIDSNADPKTPPRPGDIQKIVRVIIPDTFDPSQELESNVTIKDFTSVDDEDNDMDNGDGDDAKNNDKGASPFDIDLTKQLKSGKYAEIRLIIENDHFGVANYKFYSGLDILGVGVSGSKGNIFNFCGAHLVPSNKDGNQVAVFYVPSKPISPKPVDDSAGFNFGLVPNNIDGLSLFVDPKVKNSG